MKYTIPGDPALTEAMRNGLVQVIRRQGMVHLTAEEAAGVLSPEELRRLRGQTILAIHCTYLGESLASIVLFREEDKPFVPDDVTTLRAIGPVFAVALATMVRGSEEPSSDEHDESEDEEEGGSIMDEPDDSSPRRRDKKDDADWWKRGEQPPF
jgi:hypothetical protein